jgi:hypothetical protein
VPSYIRITIPSVLHAVVRAWARVLRGDNRPFVFMAASLGVIDDAENWHPCALLLPKLKFVRTVLSAQAP